MRLLSLFSGLGGFSRAFGFYGWQTAAFCEIEDYPYEWLTQNWPDVPCFRDVRNLKGSDVEGSIDIITGGFPCQDISVAGKGAGIEGERSGLWAEMHRLVCELRPDWVLAENVPRLRTLGADRVLGDLEAAGYSCWPLVVGADDIGAPHRRKRVWIVAHRNGVGCEGERRAGLLDGERAAQRDNADGCNGARVADAESIGRTSEGERRTAQVTGLATDVAQKLADAERERLEEPRRSEPRPLSDPSPIAWPAGRGQPQHDWEPPRVVSRAQLVMGGDFDGLPVNVGSRHNRARLKAMGNSIVTPLTAQIAKVITAIHLRSKA